MAMAHAHPWLPDDHFLTLTIKVNGTTGEGVSMTTKERLDVVNEWVKASALFGQTVMVQVGGTNMADVKTLAREAEKAKVSSILCLADLFFRPSTVDDLLKYLNIVSKEAPSTPLLYYHIPSFTGINVDVRELLRKRNQVPTLVGVKFTDNDLVVGRSCVSSDDTRDAAVFLGSDSLLLAALTQGFDSAIGTTINMFPYLNKQILKYYREDDIKKATQSQMKLNKLIEQITRHGSWVSTMKAAMRRLTPIDVGPVRDPLINVSVSQINLNLAEIEYHGF
ncbi:hypothetical protein RUM44_002880 [Polyplax serrata]|uniref:4-hydroxy-2-oxoglutarate aldolase, mitochondrial n=1 Tax=Polyplax serrata TaxID=468196 RepID=A0ABR1AX15_POLSC